MAVAAKPIYRAFDVYNGHCAQSTFYKWVEEGRVRLLKAGGNSYCKETFPEIVRRLAGEDQGGEATRGKAGREAAAARPDVR